MMGFVPNQSRFQRVHRVICALLTLVLMFGNVPVVTASVDTSVMLPEPGTMVTMSQPHQPAMMKGLTIFEDNPLKFNFIIDRGEDDVNQESRELEYEKIVRYFLAALTTPEEDLWVNLSPYEEGRMIPEKFSHTEMGRDLLAQDYLLKQLTASLLYPEDEIGSAFWQRVYQKAQSLYGSTDIPVNTFNKVWVVPQSATVFERGGSAFIAESRLKVMMEADYLAQAKGQQLPEESNALAAEVIREVVIPEIERELNEGEHFTPLRQMYQALILATWYKQSLREGLLGQVYVDRNKVKGVDIADKDEKLKIYNQYLAAFRRGVYNYIKEDVDPVSNAPVIRQYFSGGAGLQLEASGVYQSTSDFAQLSRISQRNLRLLLADDPQAAVTQLENVIVNLQEITPDVDYALMAIDQWRTDSRVGILTGGQLGHVNKPDELIAVTDDSGRVVGSMPKSIAHREGVPHMAVNIYIYDSRGRLLLQRRSTQKGNASGKLQVSVSGHVDKDEDVLTAALREGQEELGVELSADRLNRVTSINEIYREEVLPDAIIRKFVTVYAYQVTDAELAQIETNYNLNEVSELWLIAPALFEAMVARHSEDFSRSLLNILSDQSHAIYHRVRTRMPDFAMLVRDEGDATPKILVNEEEDQALILTADQVERKDEIVARGYVGFFPADWQNPPVWMQNVLDHFKATNEEAYHDLMAKIQAGFMMIGHDEKDMLEGFRHNEKYLIATNSHQHPEITLLKLLDPEAEQGLLLKYNKWTAKDDAIGNLIGYTAGVIATSVRAFASEQLFDLFEGGQRSPTMADMEAHLNARGRNANKGYLHGILYTFAKLGWLTRSTRQANDDMAFTLTEKGVGVLGAVSAYARAADFDRIAVKLSKYLRDESPRETEEVFNKILGELATLSSRGWDLPDNMDEGLRQEVLKHLNGFVVGPLLTALRDKELDISPHLIADQYIDLEDYAPNQLSLGRFRAAFAILQNVGFVEVFDTRVRMTIKGAANFRRTLNYGVPVSYYPAYALAEEFLFGDAKGIKRYIGEIETLVDRFLNTDGSDKSHEGYFKKVKAEFRLIVEGMFNDKRIPTPEAIRARMADGGEPFTFMISDVGAGKGGFLLNMYEVVMDSDLGQLINDHPDLYQIVLVGIDFNQDARTNMAANFEDHGVPHIILDGDIGKPSEILDTMRAKFDEMQVHPDIMFNIRSMLDHNRQWAEVKDVAAAEAREPISTSVFAYRGEHIPNGYVEQNLMEHFSGWADLADELLIIELHTIDEDVAATNLDVTLDIPYYVSHLFSDQYIVERPVFVAMAEEAGYRVQALATYPPDREELTTVGIYHFVKEVASDQMIGAAEPVSVAFSQERTTSGQPMLWRTAPIALDEVVAQLSSGDNTLQEAIADARRALRDNLGLDDVLIQSLPDYDGHGVQVAVLGEQPTNSFKPWIAYGVLQEAAINDRLEKIITATTGNQGIAIAYVANVLSAYYSRKFEAVIYVGKNTPIEKLEQMERLGATIIGDPRQEPLYQNYDEAFAAADAESGRLGERAYYVYHADTPAVTSYAALGDAIVDGFVADGKDLSKSAIFVPVGAGGIASGVAIAAKLRNPETKVILVQTERTRHAYDSFLQGEILNYVDEYPYKFDEDGIDTKAMEPLAFQVLSRLADGLVMVDSTRIKEKIGFKKLHGIKAEGAAVIPYLAMEELAADLRDEGIEHILNIGTGSNISDLQVLQAMLLLPEGRLQAVANAQKYPAPEVLTPGNVMVFEDKISSEDLGSMFDLSSAIAGDRPEAAAAINEEGKMLLASKVSAFFGDPQQKKSFGHQLPLAIYMNQQISFVSPDWQDITAAGPINVLGVITSAYKHPKLDGKAEVTVRTMIVGSKGELLLDGESKLLVDAGEQYTQLPRKPKSKRGDTETINFVDIRVSEEMEVTADLLEQMSAVSGDFNPVHQSEDSAVDDQYGIFEQRIAHGLLGGSLMSGFARTGRLFDGVSYDEQTFTFLKAVFVGDRVRVRMKISEDIAVGDSVQRRLVSQLEKWDGDKWDAVILGESILTVVDQALTAEDNVGGIDLSPTRMNLQIKRDNLGVPLPVDLQPVQQLQIEGFVPVIIEITPIRALPLLIGVLDGENLPEDPYSSAHEPLALKDEREEQLAEGYSKI